MQGKAAQCKVPAAGELSQKSAEFGAGLARALGSILRVSFTPQLPRSNLLRKTGGVFEDQLCDAVTAGVL